MRKHSSIMMDLEIILERLNSTYNENPSYDGVMAGEAFARIKEDIVPSNMEPCETCGKGYVLDELTMIRNDVSDWKLLCGSCQEEHNAR